MASSASSASSEIELASSVIELADGSLNTGERIAEEEKQPKLPEKKASGSRWPYKKRRCTGPRYPRVVLEPPKRVAYRKQRDECVEAALSFWNNKTMNRKRNPGPEYELVEALLCCRVPFPLVYHCNFTARPKNEADAETQLFFAEVQYRRNKIDKTTHEYECCCCCILGPVGTETGLRRCKICDLDEGEKEDCESRIWKLDGGKEKEHKILVHHPTNGFRRRQGI